MHGIRQAGRPPDHVGAAGRLCAELHFKVTKQDNPSNQWDYPVFICPLPYHFWEIML